MVGELCRVVYIKGRTGDLTLKRQEPGLGLALMEYILTVFTLTVELRTDCRRSGDKDRNRL